MIFKRCSLEIELVGKMVMFSDEVAFAMISQKKKGEFHHSSFLAGGATIAAGRLAAEDGILKVVFN